MLSSISDDAAVPSATSSCGPTHFPTHLMADPLRDGWYSRGTRVGSGSLLFRAHTHVSDQPLFATGGCQRVPTLSEAINWKSHSNLSVSPEITTVP